jgi:hypothetical protein
MHQSAYHALVQDFGQRTVGYYGEKTRFKLRYYIAEELDEWLSVFPAEFAQHMAPRDTPTDMRVALDQRNRVIRLASSGQDCSRLAPLTQLWRAPNVPLVGHYWGGATVEEILLAAPKESIIDYLVFQWARHYLRIDIAKPGSGSQNHEVALPSKIFAATLAMLRKKKFSKRDFDGTLFR